MSRGEKMGKTWTEKLDWRVFSASGMMGVLQNVEEIWRQVKMRRLLSDFISASHYCVLKVADSITFRLREQSSFLITGWLTLVWVGATLRPATHACMSWTFVCLLRLSAEQCVCYGWAWFVNVSLSVRAYSANTSKNMCLCARSLNIHQTRLHHVINKVIQPK